jgi:hypothetical protein
MNKDVGMIGYCGLDGTDFESCNKVVERYKKEIRKIRKNGLDRVV